MKLGVGTICDRCIRSDSPKIDKVCRIPAAAYPFNSASYSSKMVLKVAVVGAGAAGLGALRRLAASPEKFSVVAFEKQAVVGGTWVYNEEPVDGCGSIYKNLRTNLPKEVMAFPEFPFCDNGESFIPHESVRQYLDDFADKYNLRPYIKFNTTVNLVAPIRNASAKVTWEVRYSRDHYTDETTIFVDAVFVCNGHYSKPLTPKLEGAENFLGLQLHSNEYRHPEDFHGKNVLCLGAAASGQDIVLDLVSQAKQVYLCSNKPKLTCPLPSKVLQRPGVERLTERTAVLNDGSHVHIDVIMYCTGYLYSFPFLADECGLKIEDERVTPLYKHLMHIHYPSLCFIGLCKKIVPFTVFDTQVQFCMAYLDGTMQLPTTAAMLESEVADFRFRTDDLGWPQRYAHLFGDLQWGYNNDLLELAGFELMPPVLGKLYAAVHAHRKVDLLNYKHDKYTITGDSTFSRDKIAG